MAQEVHWYVLTYYRHLMTPEEARAYRDSHLLMKAEAYDSPDSWRRTRAELSREPAVLELLKDGREAFYQRTAERILRDHPGEVFLNYCPRCGALARTPRARQCPNCFFSWRETATAASPED